ncbi:MAG: hypothetical protein MUC99_05715 [Anaerolineae bacterium]|jgi:hypothetical protein|nr:hypothetical protein [Anaerolineae bacterium]
MTLKELVEQVLSLAPHEQEELFSLVVRARQREPIVDSAPEMMSSDDIERLLHGTPKTGAEIARSPDIGAWGDLGIEDSAAWVDELKAKRRVRKS